MPVNSAKVIITVTLYAIRFLNSLSYSFFFVTNVYIYIYMYIFLFTANAAKEAMLPYFPQIVEFIKVITALPVDSDVK